MRLPLRGVWLVAITGLLACKSGTDGSDGTGDGTDTDDTDTLDDTDDSDTEDTDTEETDDTDVDVDPCLVDPTVIEVGTGEDAFSALTGGQDLEMVYGPQGGWHVTCSLRAQNVTEAVNIHYTLTDVESGVVVHDSNLNSFLVGSSPPTWSCDGEFVNYQCVLSIPEAIGGATGTPPEVLCGRDVSILFRLTIPAGLPHPQAGTVLAEESVTVRLQPDADDDGPPCLDD